MIVSMVVGMVVEMYSEWLKIAPIAYVVLGLFSLFSKTPKKVIYKSYNIARKSFGVLLIIMGLYIGGLGVFSSYLSDAITYSSVNISTYFIAANVASYIFSSLLDSNYITKQRILKPLLRWTILNIALVANALFTPEALQLYIAPIFVVYLVIEYVIVIRAFFKLYRKVQDTASEYYSDNITPFMKWMLYSLYIMILMGFFGCAHAFYPPVYNLIYGIVSIIAFVYISLKFNNYMVTINEIYLALDDNIVNNESDKISTDVNKTISLQEALNKWVSEKNFAKAGITIEDLAYDIKSNRTYISSYIRAKYNIPYRDWISLLRVEYAKELLTNRPDLLVSQIADTVGYNRSSFTKAFVKECGISPTLWREQQLASS